MAAVVHARSGCAALEELVLAAHNGSAAGYIARVGRLEKRNERRRGGAAMPLLVNDVPTLPQMCETMPGDSGEFEHRMSTRTVQEQAFREYPPPQIAITGCLSVKPWHGVLLGEGL
jgi:hypothetical protein